MINDIVHRQWLITAVGSGLIVMLGIVLTYTAGWRPREEEREKGGAPLNSLRNWASWYLGTFPWIITVILVAIAIWTFVYPVLKVLNPPNW